jgi:hypothetical protein
MRFHAIMGAALAALLIAVPAQAETLSNADVVELSSIGLGDEAVIAKIKTSSNQFQLTTDDMIALKKSGVSGAVIAAMLEASSGAAVSANAQMSGDSPDPLIPHPSGIYLLASWAEPPKMQVLDPTTSNQTKTGGFFGYAMTGGLASMSFKTVIPNSAARVKSTLTRPTFYFYFDQANRSLSTDGQNAIWQSGTVTSPNEFSLVRFDVKKNSREAKVGKFNIGGAKAGVMDKDRIAFSYETVVPGVFKVTPDADLPAGEYGFLYSSTTGGGVGMAGMGATTSKIFDFSIPGTIKAK